MNQSILILTALQHEAVAIAKRFPQARIEIIGLRAAYPWDADDAKRVILAGLAGALDPDIACGDVILDEASDASFRNTIPPSVRVGRIITTDAIVSSAKAKVDLFHQTGALAVDMEAAHVRATAMKRNLPFAHLRAISDSADHSIDPVVLSFIDDRGKPRLGVVARALLARPSLISQVAQLRSQSALALDHLCNTLGCLLK